ncbi:MAG: hypothetical protein RLZZ553_1488 [Verrucomicrobiota bacterium]|jgi:hypothetical protein
MFPTRASETTGEGACAPHFLPSLIAVIIGAIMHKLLHIVYGVLKSQQPFDPKYLEKNQKSA